MNELYPNPRGSGFVRVDLEANLPVRIHHPAGMAIECLPGQTSSGCMPALGWAMRPGPALPVDLNDFVEGRWISGRSGRLAWSGGRLSCTSARCNLPYHLPALSGTLTLDRGAIAATVSERESSSTLCDFWLTRDGWGKISMRGRLFDLVKQPWPIKGEPGAVVMELESRPWQ